MLILPGEFDGGSGDAIESRSRHGLVRVIARRQQVVRIAGAGLERDEDVERLVREMDLVVFRALG